MACGACGEGWHVLLGGERLRHRGPGPGLGGRNATWQLGLLCCAVSAQASILASSERLATACCLTVLLSSAQQQRPAAAPSSGAQQQRPAAAPSSGAQQRRPAAAPTRAVGVQQLEALGYLGALLVTERRRGRRHAVAPHPLVRVLRQHLLRHAAAPRTVSGASTMRVLAFGLLQSRCNGAALAVPAGRDRRPTLAAASLLRACFATAVPLARLPAA